MSANADNLTCSWGYMNITKFIIILFRRIESFELIYSYNLSTFVNEILPFKYEFLLPII